MTERELIELGFRRVDVKAEESFQLTDYDWYYYEYIFGGDYVALDLASFTDEDSFPRTGEENDWHIRMDEIDDSIHITDISDVKVLIDSIYKIIGILYKNK